MSITSAQSFYPNDDGASTRNQCGRSQATTTLQREAADCDTMLRIVCYFVTIHGPTAAKAPLLFINRYAYAGRLSALVLVPNK